MLVICRGYIELEYQKVNFVFDHFEKSSDFQHERLVDEVSIYKMKGQ